MAVLVGIDEAGYGPILGPLVVSSAAFSVPDELLGTDLWRKLSRAVSKKKTRLNGRLLITDSKKAYSKSAGIGHLRRAVLAHLSCLQSSPADAAGLLRILCWQSCPRLSGYPWYENLKDFPLGANADDIQIAASVLEKSFAANGIKLLSLKADCLDVGHYNRMVSAVKNKARVLFTAVSSLIKDAFDNCPEGQTIQIIIDRQGGRINYLNSLSLMFPQMEIQVIRQDATISSYQLTGEGRVARIHFTTKADTRFLPVALTSMTAKYIRQVLVKALNEYFIGHCKELKPTAGYWQDGLRFIKDVQTNLPTLKYDEQQLIRTR